MSAASFEFRVSVPHDARYAGALRELAAHAARFVGCEGDEADAYASVVESVARASLSRGGRTPIPAVLRRGGGPLEFLIVCEADVDIGRREEHTTVQWIQEEGRRMCRVARDI